jgi:NAD-dependent dihydropyrimidine dehydrogenase PreA subunit
MERHRQAQGRLGAGQDAPEATKGFCSTILSRTPAAEGRWPRWSNSDPITGQAAWFDLRVSIEKADGAGERDGAAVRGAGPGRSARGAGKLPMARRRWNAHDQLPGNADKKLGLVIDLDTCVGCHACVTSCKEWNTGGYSAPLSDHDPYGADPSGAFLNRVHSFEMEIGGRGPAHGPFPALLPALRGARLRHRLPDRRQLQARGGRDRSGQ